MGYLGRVASHAAAQHQRLYIDAYKQSCPLILQVGRTGRAGNAGNVTSLYLPEQAILAEAIRAAIDGGEPIEGAFSRNRSFSKKVKKYGKYVPRGEAPQYAAR